MKNFNFKLTSLFALLIFVGFAVNISAQDRPDRPEQIQFPELNPLVVPDVYTFEHNGIQFFLLEDDELPLISMSVRIKAGSWQVGEEKTGLTGVTGEVMRSGGTVNMTGDELNSLLEGRAASIETGFGLTSGTASLNTLAEDFEELLDVFIEVLTQPAFPQDKLDLAITQRRSNIARRNDSPAGIAGREFGNILYGKGTIYNTTLEYHHLNNITLNDLVDFHRNAVVAPNLMVAVTGDFNTSDMQALLINAFSQIPDGEGNEFDFPEIDYTFESSINFIDRSDMNQSIIRIGHIGGFRDNPDYAALQVMNQVLSGGFSGRLMQEVRTRLGLAYGVGGGYSSSVLYPGQFFISLSTESSNTAAAINASLGEIRRLQTEMVPQQELDDTRGRFLNSLVFRNENRSSVLFEQLNNTYLGLPLDAFEQYVEDVRKVTVEDIYRVANEYLRPEDVHILVVGNSALIDDQLDQFGDVNIIDITIPRPDAEPREEIAGDATAGAEWLQRMSDALVGGNSFETAILEGELGVNTPQGRMNVDVKINYTFPSSLTQELNTPFGSQTIIYENGSAKMMAGGMEQPIPNAEQFQDQINRHYLNVALNSSSLSAQYLGTEEVDGIMLHKLFITDYEMTFLLTDDTALPVMMMFDQFNPATGGDVTVVTKFANWTDQNGVFVAYSEEQLVDDEVQASFTFSDHSVE